METIQLIKDITLNELQGMIPIDHNQILTMIPHINTTNIPFNYQEITNFIGSRIFGVGKYFHSKSTRP